MHIRNICLILIVTLFSGCASVQKDWDSAQSIDNREAYLEFIEKYPSNVQYRPLALQRLETIEYEEASRIGTIEAYSKFLEEYGDSKFAPQATKMRENVRFNLSKERNTISELDKYLEEYPNGVFLSEVNKLRENARFSQAKEKNTISELDKYLKEYPNGAYVSEMNKLRENVRFSQAKKENTISEFDKYLKEYPNGAYVSEVNKLREVAMFEKAEYRDTTESFKSYLERYPNGNFVSQANKRLQKLALKQKQKDISELTKRQVNSKAKIVMKKNANPTTQKETKGWVYIFKGVVSKLYSVPGFKGLVAAKNVSMFYAKDGIDYSSLYAKPGELIFERYDDILLLIGIGSEIEFDDNDWVEFLGDKYKEGGFKVTNDGIVFIKGTKKKLGDTISTFFNGEKWE